MKLGFVIVFCLLVISGVIGKVAVDKLFNNSTPSTVTPSNIEYSKKAFVNACISSAMSAPDADESMRGIAQNYCQCVHDDLSAKSNGNIKYNGVIDSNGQITANANASINKCLEQI